MWEVFPTVVFTYPTYGEEADEENFFWTTPKLEVTQSNLNYIPGGGYSFKEILLNFGLRKAGIVGTGEKSRIMRVRCPYCKDIDEITDKNQVCSNCNKLFYLY
jgi:phage FluMu protein Com